MKPAAQTSGPPFPAGNRLHRALARPEKIVDLMCRGGRYHIHCLVNGTAGYGTLSRRNRIVETLGKELRAMMP